MLTKAAAQSLMQIVPEKVSATVSLRTDGGASTSVDVTGCWWKPLKTSAPTYSGVPITGRETLLNVPDASLNPAANGRVIKPYDEITVGAETFVVAAANLKSVRTRWECLVHRKMS
jgi:hypothetical protein